MAFDADRAILLDRLDEELRRATEPTVDLFSKVIASACTRIQVLSKSGKVGRMERLIQSGAFTDAAFTLIALERPAWSLRRLACEDGKWFCSLSREARLPAALDDTADAVHELMPLAILLAFVQACRMTALAPEARTTVPQVAPLTDGFVCCDNFV
jgi:hypothetical protein